MRNVHGKVQLEAELNQKLKRSCHFLLCLHLGTSFQLMHQNLVLEHKENFLHGSSEFTALKPCRVTGLLGVQNTRLFLEIQLKVIESLENVIRLSESQNVFCAGLARSSMCFRAKVHLTKHHQFAHGETRMSFFAILVFITHYAGSNFCTRQRQKILTCVLYFCLEDQLKENEQ